MFSASEKYIKRSLLIFFTLLVVACSTGKNPQDPYEKTNRQIYAFNQVFDKAFVKPLAKLYRGATPAPIRKAVGNIFSNFAEITTFVNDMLQGKLSMALTAATRFTINSTVGVGGIFDFASDWHLKKHRQDLGITLAMWGDVHSPYLVIPFLGPSTMRDAYGLSFDYMLFSIYPAISSEKLRYSLLALYYLHVRAALLDTDELIEKAALDPYAFTRDAYLQLRASQIRKNKFGEESEGEDLYIEEDEDEDTDKKEDKTEDKKKENKQETSAHKKYILRSSYQPINLIRYRNKPKLLVLRI